MPHPPILVVILDGVGDRPHPSFGGATPLSAASTQNLDALAARGQTGLIDVLGPGIVPGSSSGHLALFDLDPFHDAPSRGAVEALGLGVPPGERTYAARGNFVTLDAQGRIADRRAGRFSEPEEREQAAQLIGAMNDAAPGGVAFLYDRRMGYRFVVKIEGTGLGGAVTDTDPGAEGSPAKAAKGRDPGSDAAAKLLNQALQDVAPALAKHAVNAARAKADLPPATGFVTRGFGRVVAGPPVKERFGVHGRAVAGGNAYRGLARYFGLELVDCKGATGDLRADFDDKVDTAIAALDGADLVYLHIKAPDVCGENGDFAGKRDALTRIDQALAPLTRRQDIVVGLTGDHSTPCIRKAHSGDPVPVLFSGPGVRPDATRRLTELDAMGGGVGRIRGGDFLRTLLDLGDWTKKRE